MLRVWLKDQSPAKVDEAAAAMQTMPAVTAVWRRHGDHYDLVSPVRWDRMTLPRRAAVVRRQGPGAGRHRGRRLRARPDRDAPGRHDVLRPGDHGGIQRAAQQIPIVFAGAGLSSQDLHAEVRSVDIMPTILKAMGIPPTYPMDGVGYPLPRAK